MAEVKQETAKKGGFSFKKIASKVGRSFRDLKSEFKKIVWPSKKQVINNTLIVIVVVVILGAFIAGLDALFSWLFSLFLSI